MKYSVILTIASISFSMVQQLLLANVCFSLQPQKLISSKRKTGRVYAFGTNKASVASLEEMEENLLECINSLGGRIANSEKINDIIELLENRKEQSIQRPAISQEIYGRWKLIYSTNADTSSPIQRTAFGSSNKQFPIYQDIEFNERNQLIVSQVVKLSDSNELRVDALASTSAYPLPELTERKSTGKVLGLNLLGVSFIGDQAKEDKNFPDSRIDFVFDEGNFDFGSFRVPYPVPFRLPVMRDLVKGWIDITYMSKKLRISRGNKGTTFVLVKEK